MDRPQCEQIALNPEPTNLPFDDIGEHRVVPERLPRMNVRHVQFDDRTGEDRKRVADAIAVMCPRARIDQHSVLVLFVSAMDALATLRTIEAVFASARDGAWRNIA